jgi:hypothetical protein
VPTIYNDGEPAGNGHPSSEFFDDWHLLTQRGQALAFDVINGKGRLAELQQVNKAVDRAWRLFRRWQRNQISLNEMTAAVRHERLLAEAGKKRRAS